MLTPVQRHVNLCFLLIPFPHHLLAFHRDDVQHVPKRCPNWSCFVTWKYKLAAYSLDSQHQDCLQTQRCLDSRIQPGRSDRHAVLLSRTKVRNHVCGTDEAMGEVGADCLKLLKGCE